MADVEQLLREFQRDFEAGGTLRPSDVLARVEGADRRELEALIDAYPVSYTHLTLPTTPYV